VCACLLPSPSILCFWGFLTEDAAHLCCGPAENICGYGKNCRLKKDDQKNITLQSQTKIDTIFIYKSFGSKDALQSLHQSRFFVKIHLEKEVVNSKNVK